MKLIASDEKPRYCMSGNRTRNSDVLVIGAGLGGLAAAAKLAQEGLKVQVFERHRMAGGYAHCFPRRARDTQTVYDFDVSMHQLGDLRPGRPFHRMLSDLGLLDGLRIRRFHFAYRTVGPRHDLLVPAARLPYQRRLESAFPDQRRGIRDLFQHVFEIGEMKEGELSPLARESLSLSLQDCVRQHVSDQRLIHVFGLLSGYLGTPSHLLAALPFALMWVTYHEGGCYYVEGGGKALVDALVAKIRTHGGEVHLRSPVENILTAGGKVIGIETRNQGSVLAPVVVSNASPEITFSQLLDQPGLARQPRTSGRRHTVGASYVQMYLGIRGKVPQLERLRLVTGHYDSAAEWAAIQRGRFKNQFVSISNHNRADPNHSPDGCSILHATMVASGEHWSALNEADYREAKLDVQEHLLDRLTEVIPDLRSRLEICEIGTPRTMQRYSGNPEGAIFGYLSNQHSHTVLRPRPKTSIPGLYLAGAWTFPMGGYQGAFTSGVNTAGLVGKYFGKQKSL